MTDEKKEMVQISKSDLAEIKSAIGKIGKLEKANKRLTYAANKARLAHFDAAEAGPKLKTVKINYYNNKVILGWKMKIDEIETNAFGIMQAKQVIRLFHKDKDDFTDIEYVNFKKVEKKVADVIKDVTDDVTKDRVLDVKVRETGKEYKIAIEFVN